MGSRKVDGKGCSNRKLEEKQLRAIILEGYNTEYSQACNMYGHKLEQFQKLLDSVIQSSDNENILRKLQKEYEKIQQEENLLVEKLLQGIVTDAQFCSFMEKKKEEKNKLCCKIEELKREDLDKQHNQKRCENIWQEMTNGSLLTKVFEELAVEQVKKVIVHENELSLEIVWSNTSNL